jgi:mono/diheme cytochrome c family protein
MARRRLLLALAAALLVGVGGLIGVAASGGGNHDRTSTSTPTPTPTPVAVVDPHVAAGAHDFVQFACAQCHGELGRGGVSPDVPALAGVATKLTPSELRSIIDHGLGESSNPTRPYMPVWGAVISKTQVNDLIAYLRAGLPKVPTAEPPAVPSGQGEAVEGSALYERYGCINCHGPNGLGGVPNPQAPDRAIPPLSGQDFRKEFNTDAKIIAVIRSGSVIGRAPIVSMPHWGGIIPDERLRALVAYLKTLQ